MVLHLAALAPSASAIAKYVGSQLKTPLARSIGVDPLSQAVHKGSMSFLTAFDEEYRRTETLTAILGDATKKSLSTFVGFPAVLDLLLSPLIGDEDFDTSRLAALWDTIPAEDGSKLAPLPAAFDWGSIRESYLGAVRKIVSETPGLREKRNAKNLDDLVTTVKEIRGVAPTFTIEKYRAALLQEYGTLKLSSIRAGYDPTSSDRPVGLQRIYVHQRAKEAFPPRDLSRDYRKRLAAKAWRLADPTDSEREHLMLEYEKIPTRPMPEILADDQCQRVVILGDPGLGKSTLLQHLALDWAEGKSRLIPFLIELRKYTRDHAKARSFLEFLEIGTWSTCHLSQSELDQRLNDGEAVILFDGLDEIFDETLRGNIVAEIIGFARDYPGARVLVTTRVAGYAVGSPNPDTFRAAGFRQFTLQDFSETEIAEFISKWYAARVEHLGERDELTLRLNSDIAGSMSIKELAGNPLLLTMMALLNRRKQLPRERIKLYEACAELLVEGWDAARHLERSAYLTHDDKVEILQRIAYEMQDERRGLSGNMISENRLKNILATSLRDRSVDKPHIAAAKIVNGLVERDFMLCFVGDEQFSFVHRTFLEYFCAKEYKSQLENGKGADELAKVFRERWPDDAWHEVLRLICAMVGPDLAGKLVRELLSARSEDKGWHPVFLAAECIGEVRQLGKIAFEVEQTHQALIELIDYEEYLEGYRAIEATDKVISVRTGAIRRLARYWAGQSTTKSALVEAFGKQYWKPRFAAVEELVRQWHDEDIRSLLKERAENLSSNWGAHQAAIHGLAQGWPDDQTHQFLIEQLNSATEKTASHTILTELSEHWASETTREWLKQIATAHRMDTARRAAVREIARRWPDEETHEWLLNRAANEDDAEVAAAAASELVALRRDAVTSQRLLEIANKAQNSILWDSIVGSIAWVRPTDEIRNLIVERMSDLRRPIARKKFITTLGTLWPDERTRQTLTSLAEHDPQSTARSESISVVASTWLDNASLELLKRLYTTDKDQSVKKKVADQLKMFWPDDPEVKHLTAQGGSQKAD